MSAAQSKSLANLIRWVLYLVLIGLAIITAYQIFSRQPQYQIQVFATSTGWGYDILNNGKLLIHQPTVPGQAGTVGFASQEQARRVGEWVAEKVQQNKALPTLTNDELRRLGVTIP